MSAKHVTTLSFGRPAQSVALLACPLPPAAGSYANRTWCRCNPFAKWHRRRATPSTIQSIEVVAGR